MPNASSPASRYSNWAEIDLSAIENNIGRLRAITGVPVMAVVKANADGQPATMTYPAANLGKVDEQVVFGYHPQGLLNSVVGTSSYVVSTDYDAAGRVDKRTLGSNTLKTGYEYFPWTSQGGRLWKLQSGTTAVPGLRQNFEYEYDLVGNVSWIKDSYAGSPQTQEFTYDELDRLLTAKAINGSIGNYGPESYSYDDTTGNLDSMAGTAYSYSTQSAICPGGALSKPHAVVSAGSNMYCYDANGNMVRRKFGETEFNLSYDEENRLTSVSGAGGRSTKAMAW